MRSRAAASGQDAIRRDVLEAGCTGLRCRLLRRLLDPVVLRGRDQVQGWSDREGEMWEGGHTRWQPEELIDAGDKVLAFIRTGGRGTASGVEVEAYVWNV